MINVLKWITEGKCVSLSKKTKFICNSILIYLMLRYSAHFDFSLFFENYSLVYRIAMTLAFRFFDSKHTQSCSFIGWNSIRYLIFFGAARKLIEFDMEFLAIFVRIDNFLLITSLHKRTVSIVFQPIMVSIYCTPNLTMTISINKVEVCGRCKLNFNLN